MTAKLLLIFLVTTAAITDLASRRIPNALIASGLAAALMLQVFLPDGGGWSEWLFGMLTGFALFLPLYILGGMAAGDVKLMAAVGAFVGPEETLQIALATCLIGGIWSLAVILFSGKGRATWINLRAIITRLITRSTNLRTQAKDKPHESVGRLPYGVAIALGTTMSMFW